MVAQDGNSESTSQVVNKYGLELFQNPRFINLRGGQIDGATRIAMHYKFALTSAFDKRPNAPAMIIVEDDLLFAPDFYEVSSKVYFIKFNITCINCFNIY